MHLYLGSHCILVFVVRVDRDVTGVPIRVEDRPSWGMHVYKKGRLWRHVLNVVSHIDQLWFSPWFGALKTYFF